MQNEFLFTDVKSESESGREVVAGSTEMLNIPSPIPEVDEALRDDLMLVCAVDEILCTCPGLFTLYMHLLSFLCSHTVS